MNERWSVVAFVGAGRAWGRNASFGDTPSEVSRGMGLRYLVFGQSAFQGEQSVDGFFLGGMIVGQNAKFIEVALNAYKSGERKHPTMGAIAGTLSDKDIAELAAYYGKGAAK